MSTDMNTEGQPSTLRDALSGIKTDIRMTVEGGELRIDIGDLLERALHSMEPEELAAELGARDAVLRWAVEELADRWSTPHWEPQFNTARRQFLAKIREQVYKHDLEKLIGRITEAERYRTLYHNLWHRVPSEFLEHEPKELQIGGDDWHEARRLWREEISAFLRTAVSERAPQVDDDPSSTQPA